MGIKLPKSYSLVNKFLICLFFIAMLLCGFLGFRNEVGAQNLVDSRQKSEEQIRQNVGWVKHAAKEPMSPVEAALRPVTSSHRVGSSRPTRLLPTHGSKQGQHHGKGGFNGFLTSTNHLLLRQCCAFDGLHMVSASPRLYYVIALRRILC